MERREFLKSASAAFGGLAFPSFFSSQLLGQTAGDLPTGKQPNIILIMCDDAGFADFGYSGGISDTPVLDELASQGVRFCQAYCNARCMPTRASLMTGLNPQLVGENRLNGQCVTIPEVLKDAGYSTYMIGKWHLGTEKTVDRDTGQKSIPTARGFDRFYGIWAGASQPRKAKLVEAWEKRIANDGKGFAPRIIEDGRVLPWDEVPDGYYNTTNWTDKAIEYIKSTPDDRPFFLYAAYTPPHWPLDPDPDEVARYKGRFDDGWDAVRARVLQRQKEIGLIPEDYPLPPREYGIHAFEPGSPEADKYTRGCETYYASITEMDTQIGRIVDTVKRMGRGKNTLVVFLSDNGADDVIGGGPRGNASNMPFMGYKLTYYDGGAATPMFAWWPGVIPANTINTGQQVMLEDCMATFVELAGAKYPTERLGQPIHPMQGRSIVRAMCDPEHVDPQRTWCWSHDGQRGVWHGDWKAVMINKNHPAAGKSYFDGTKDGWYLYHLDENRVESRDLADANPERLKEMIGIWKDWAQEVRWRPSPRWGLHSTDAANGITSYGD